MGISVDIAVDIAKEAADMILQSGWFAESLPTQTLIIHIIRTNKIPLLQSRSSWPVLVMSLIIMALGVAIPFSALGPYLRFSTPPPLYWRLLAAILLCYILLTHGVKMWLVRRKWI